MVVGLGELLPLDRFERIGTLDRLGRLGTLDRLHRIMPLGPVRRILRILPRAALLSVERGRPVPWGKERRPLRRERRRRRAPDLGGTRLRALRRGRLVERPAGDARGLAAGQQPTDDRRRHRHGDDDEEEVEPGHLTQRGETAVELAVTEPTGGGDIGGRGAEDGAEQSEGTGRDRGQLRRVNALAPVAVSVRRSPAVSLRMRPTLIASTPRARTMPKTVAQLLISADVGSEFFVSM